MFEKSDIIWAKSGSSLEENRKSLRIQMSDDGDLAKSDQILEIELIKFDEGSNLGWEKERVKDDSKILALVLG